MICRIGVRADRTVTYSNDSVGVKMNYEAVGGAISAMRAMPCACDMAAVDDSFFDEVREYADSQLI